MFVYVCFCFFLICLFFFFKFTPFPGSYNPPAPGYSFSSQFLQLKKSGFKKHPLALIAFTNPPTISSFFENNKIKIKQNKIKIKQKIIKLNYNKS